MKKRRENKKEEKKRRKKKKKEKKCIYFQEEGYECVLKEVVSFRSAVYSAVHPQFCDHQNFQYTYNTIHRCIGIYIFLVPDSYKKHYPFRFFFVYINTDLDTPPPPPTIIEVSPNQVKNEKRFKIVLQN